MSIRPQCSVFFSPQQGLSSLPLRHEALQNTMFLIVTWVQGLWVQGLGSL